MDQQAALGGDDAFWGTPEPATERPDGAEGGSRRRWFMTALGAAVVGAVAVAGINFASSQTATLATGGPGGGGPGGFGPGGGRTGGPGRSGTITALNGATITMTTNGGPIGAAGETVPVLTSPSTAFTTAVIGSVADIKVGDNVTVQGTTSGTTVTAQRLTTGAEAAAAGNAPAPPGGAAPDGRGGPPTEGVVTMLNGSSFTLTTAGGNALTVNTSAATVVTVLRPGSLGALLVGDQIQVSGATGTDGAITATSVRSGVAAQGPGPGDGRPAAA